MVWRKNIELVAYADLGGKPAFKLAMQEVGGHFFLTSVACGIPAGASWTSPTHTSPITCGSSTAHRLRGPSRSRWPTKR